LTYINSYAKIQTTIGNTKYKNIIKAIKELAVEYFSSKRCLFHYTFESSVKK